MANAKQTRRKFLWRTAILLGGVGTLSKGCASAEKSAKKADGFSYKVILKPTFTGTKEEALAMSEEDANAMRKHNFWHNYISEKRAERVRKISNQGCGKWRIHMLGTCCGSEPQLNHNHTSWILEKPSGELVWFDAGEYCSWTAGLLPLDITKSSRVFISHPHTDHIIGLCGLIDNINTYHWVYGLRGKKISMNFTIHTPTMLHAKAVMDLVWSGRGHKGITLKLVEQGEVFRDKDIVVDAIENRHISWKLEGKCQSYSYRIKIPSISKTIVFSGDIKNEDDLAPFFKDGNIDILMIETGHHNAEMLCKRIKQKYPNAVNDIWFIHHGIDIQTNPEFEKIRADKAWGKPVIFTEDKQTFFI